MTTLTLPVFSTDNEIRVQTRSAYAVERTGNTKLSHGRKFSTTLASHHSCPDSCSFKGTVDNPDGPNGNGCYTYNHPFNYHISKLDKANEHNPTVIAQQEADSIDGLTGKYFLRVHEVGDCQTNEAALIVSSAAERYMARGGKIAFTYTHAWREVDRASFGKMSVLASCETESDVRDAIARGYVPCIVVSDFLHDTPYFIGGYKFIPCPHNLAVQVTNEKKEKEHITCATCKFCMKESWLRDKGLGVVFKAHGARAKTVKASLQF